VLTFVQAPIPTSFARESFFAVSAFRFTNASRVSAYGRYRVLPVAGNEYLDEAAPAAQTANSLFDEIKDRVAKSPVKFRIFVQLAKEGISLTMPLSAGRRIVIARACGGYHARRRLIRDRPDLRVAVLEDALAIGGGVLITALDCGQ
jgi:hypothetical protein